MSINSLTDGIKGVVTNNPVTSLVGAGVVGAGAGLVTASLIGGKTKTKTRKSRSGRDRRFISRQKHERAYQKRRRKLGKKTHGKYYKHKKKISKRKGKIHYARKTGQPYIILSNGRAKFIKGKRRK